MSPRRRKILRILLAVVAGVFVVLAALPLWLPWVMEPLTKRFGASYARYEREGYQRFRLDDVSFTNSSGRFHAARVEGFLPTVWIWRRYVGPKSGLFLRVDSWSWQSTSSKAGPAAPPSPYADFQKAQSKVALLREWLPRAELTNGMIHLNGRTIGIPRATWVNGTLSARALVPPNTNRLSLHVETSSRTPWRIRLDLPEYNINSAFTAAATNGGLTLSGTADWMSNRIELDARFPQHGLLPETAGVQADSFRIPASMFRLKRYRDLTGSLHAEWRTDHYTLELSAKALPETPTSLPPIDLAARVSGGTNSAYVDVARISAPWLKAELLRRTRVLFKPPFLTEPTVLDATIDLNQQAWFAVRGRLEGRAILLPAGQPLPQLNLTLAGTNVGTSTITSKSVQLSGELRWPQFQITEGQLVLADGSTVSVTGKYDLQQKEVQDGKLNFSGGFGRQYLPTNISFDTASIEAQFAGPLGLATLTNSVKLDIKDLKVPDANPLRLSARWNGRGLDIQHAQVALETGSSSLQMRGSANLEHGAGNLHVTGLELARSGRAELLLQQPFDLSFQRRPPRGPPATSNSGSGPPPAAALPANQTATNRPAWKLELQPLQWSGEGGELRLEANLNWPDRGTFQAQAQGLDSSLIQDFIPKKPPDVAIDHLSLTGGWTNNPAVFQLQSEAQFKAQSGLVFTANADVSGGSNGVAIDRLGIALDTQAVCQVQGTVPLVLAPALAGGLMHIQANGPLRLKMTTDPGSALWTELAAISGLQLGQPRLDVNVAGTWAAPRGQITLQAQRLKFPNIKRPLPTVENIDIDAQVTPEFARLARLDAQVAGQAVRFTASVPLTNGFWSGLARGVHLPDWHTVSAHLIIKKAELAPFADFLPKILSPEGSAHADVRLEPGGLWRGGLSVTGAVTRPLGSIGPVRSINMALVFAGQTASLTNFSAEIGGQKVTALGSVDLSEKDWQRHGLPPFEIRLHGTNVPLVRQPDLLVRADLHLALTNSAAVSVVAGTVKLRHSFFLADLQSLVPETTAGPRRRPPYFSIDVMPWADWHLRINVQGDEFMRVQTPVFNGRISANVKLQDTLKEPVALGEVRIDSGAVTFPFGTLEVSQGFISLTSENVYHPRIFLNATAQQYGYNIKLEVSGPVDKPVIQFSSTPPLSSEEIILMLTTGRLPSAIGVTASPQERAQGIAFFVGKNLLSEFGVGVGNQNRLTIRSGEYISESGRPTYEVDYRLSKRWSVVGQYDRFDQYNLNLMWKVYSK